MPICHKGGILNLASCVSIEMFTVVSDQVRMNHHGRALFPLHNAAKTPSLRNAIKATVTMLMLMVIRMMMLMRLSLKLGLPWGIPMGVTDMSLGMLRLEHLAHRRVPSDNSSLMILLTFT